MISARLLGAPLLTIDGAPAPAELLWKKHLAVCLVLWNSPEMRVSRDQLIGMLWPDKDEASARHSLNEALRVIRKAAGADALDTDGDYIKWLGPVALDTAVFFELETPAPEQAAALVTGAFCFGFSIPDAPDFDRWMDTIRRDWNTRIIRTLLSAVSAAENGGRVPESLAFAIKCCELDPWSDAAARALIRARWISGDRAGALADGRAFATRLVADLNLQPDAATRALIARIAAGRTPRIHEDLTPASRRPPFFGRYQVLSRTIAISRDVVAQSKPALIVLSGESGSGRSRLLEEIVLRATLEGTIVSTMRAVDADLDNPMALWLGLVSGGLLDAPGVLGAPSSVLAGVAAASSAWADRFPITRGATGLPLSDAVTGIVRAVADESALLLAIDDAHRLGEKGLLRIPKLMRGLVGMPVTIVVTLDTGVPSSAADELRRSSERDTPGAAMRIDKWELGDIDQLVGWAMPQWEEADRHRLARRLKSESDGRPAIAVEVLAAVKDGLQFDIDTGTWPIPDRTMESTMPVATPDSLVSAVRLAFNRLPEQAKTLLTVASMLPEPTAASTMARIAEISDMSEVDAMLDRLEWERWIVADGRGYSFPARTIRRLLETEMLTPGQRRRLEDRIVGLVSTSS